MFINKIISKIKGEPFPYIVVGLFIILVIFGISGSSMGAFDSYLLGKEPGLIAGHTQAVRSDEWLWQTQATQIQKNSGYPEINKHIGLGEDMSMILDVPFKSFYTFFKPQNLFFFVLPYKNAFAAKWWFLSLALVLGFYYFINSLFPNKRKLAIIGSIILLFNPFTQWWYQSITLLSIAYTLWIGIFVINLVKKKNNNLLQSLYILGLSFSSLSFLFLLYPPFQISVAYVMIAILLGYLYYRYFIEKHLLREDIRFWLSMVAAGILVLTIAGSFYIGHKNVIHSIEHTSYPGTRNIVSGESPGPYGATSNMEITFSAPILFNLQRAQRAVHFYTNQSEAARITAINLVILPASLYVVFKKNKKDRKLADYLVISTGILSVLFIVRMFTPFFNLPFKLLLFNQVQNERLSIGLVLLCAVQLVLFGIVSFKKLGVKAAAIIAILSTALFLDSSIIMIHQYPGFASILIATIVCTFIGVLIFLLLRPRFYVVGLILFMVFSLLSSIFINPLYDRSEPQSLISLTNVISHNYKDNKEWGVLDSVPLENVPQLSNQSSLTGIQVYPQLKLWARLSTTKQSMQAYNRYAHVLFTSNPLPNNDIFYNSQPDLLFISFTCSIAQKLPNLGYVLSTYQITNTSLLSCLKENRTIMYPNATIYIYKYQQS